MNELPLIIICLAVGSIVTWIAFKFLIPNKSHAGLGSNDTDVIDLRDLVSTRDQEIVDLRIKLGRLEQKLEDTKEYREDAEVKWKEEVNRQRENLEKVAREVLDDATKRSQTQLEGVHAERLKQLLEPVRIQFQGFQKQVEKYYGEEQQWRGALNKELEELAEMNMGLNKQAENLARALKGDSKVQGDWGEYQLERILEDVGLEKGIHFTTQSSVTSEEGKTYRPDFLVSLPDEKVLVIDSKVSLTAYERYVNADNDIDRESHLKEHIQSLRNHIRGLAKKDYGSLYNQSVDYTLMFVPIEPAFFAAGNELQSIQKEGLAAQVLLVSTTTILATLRTVSYIWRQDQQRTNVVEISARGKLLYEKFVSFSKSMESIGDHLNRADKAYHEAIAKLSTGRGNLIGQAEKLRKLGIDVKETIPEKFISDQ